MKKLENGSLTVLPYILIMAAAFLRLAVDHPYNFVPLFSCILFFGANRPGREFPIPLLALMGVDVFLTTQHYGYAISGDHAFTWAWCMVVMMLGAGMLAAKITTPRILGASLSASVGFFDMSNFAVWSVWGMYPKTGVGLVTCYIAAIPFFSNSLAVETVCSLLLFTAARYLGTLPSATTMQNRFS